MSTTPASGTPSLQPYPLVSPSSSLGAAAAVGWLRAPASRRRRRLPAPASRWRGGSACLRPSARRAHGLPGSTSLPLPAFVPRPQHGRRRRVRVRAILRQRGHRGAASPRPPHAPGGPGARCSCSRWAPWQTRSCFSPPRAPAPPPSRAAVRPRAAACPRAPRLLPRAPARPPPPLRPAATHSPPPPPPRPSVGRASSGGPRLRRAGAVGGRGDRSGAVRCWS
ncbi:hypothetical protein BS78_04G287900 [Paspalum vaginatum]|nr:hypothetical protein BS78_04G287900 [Paspalum vaginatum]